MHVSLPDRAEKKARRQREEQEQVALFQWRDMNVRRYPGIQLMFAVPNGAFLQGDKRRRAMQWKRLERAGAKKGVHDILLPVARHGKHGLWIEMKAPKGDLTDEQSSWGVSMLEQGYAAAVCWGAEQAIDIIIRYWKGVEFEAVNYLSFAMR